MGMNILPDNLDVIALADEFIGMLSKGEIVNCFEKSIKQLLPSYHCVLGLTTSTKHIEIVSALGHNTDNLIGVSVPFDSCITFTKVIEKSKPVNPAPSSFFNFDVNESNSIVIPVNTKKETIGGMLLTDEKGNDIDSILINNMQYLCNRLGIALNTSLQFELLADSNEKNNSLVSNSGQLSVLTHELRNPLNGVMALTDVLSSTMLDNNQRRIVDELGLSAKTLHRMIEQVLSYSKLRIDCTVKSNVFNFKETVSRVLSTFHSQAKKKGIALKSVCLSQCPDIIISDESAFEHILINIIGNGITYTDKGQVILFITRIKDSQNNNYLEFRIQDTGIGMTPAFIDQIYEPFVQEKNNRHNKINRGGVGLGMAITQTYIQGLNGSIDVSSELGIGSEFTVKLPVQFEEIGHKFKDSMTVSVLKDTHLYNRLRVTVRQRRNHERCKIKEKDKLTDSVRASSCVDMVHCFSREQDDDLYLFTNLFTHITEEQYNLIILCDDNVDNVIKTLPEIPYRNITIIHRAGIEGIIDYLVSLSNVPLSFNLVDDIISKSISIRRALIADDDSVSQLAIKLKLEECNIISEVVNNGMDALVRLKERHFDLVVLDIQMPQMTGIQVLEYCNEQVKNDNTLFVMLSAIDDDETINTCLDLGADAFFSKPIIKDFTYKINQLLDNYSAEVIDEKEQSIKTSAETELLIYKFPVDIFNFDNLRYSLNNSQEYTKNIILLFIEISSESVKSMSACVKNSDELLCQHYAHKLRSSAQQACIHVFEDDLYIIEKSGDKYVVLNTARKFIDHYYAIIERIYLVLISTEWISEDQKLLLIKN